MFVCLQVKKFLGHVTPDEIDLQVQKRILEKIKNNMADKPRLFKPHAADIGAWLEEYMKKTEKGEQRKGKYSSLAKRSP